MTRALLPGYFASITVLGGCAAVPADRSLPFAVPQSFSAPPGPKPEPPLDAWWMRFRSAELARLVALADTSSFDIAAAVARLDQAEAQARIAGAALFPIIGFSGGAQQSRNSGTSVRGAISSPSPHVSFNAGFSASYIIDVWGQLRDGQRAAQLIVEASAYQREVVRLATRASVVNAYLQYALTQEQLRIANENLRNAERIQGVIRERLTAGTGTALDLAQQESLVANQRANLPPLRLASANARTMLAVLLGRPPQGLVIKSARLNGFATPRVSPGLPASLLVRRPDIRAAEAQLASAEANVEAARKALLPAVQLTGQGGLQSAALAAFLRPESALFALAAGLTQPIFEGGRLRAQADFSDAQRRELLEAYRRSIIAALTDVENALAAIREGDRREAALRVAIVKARKAFMLSEERLRQGTIDLVILLNTQQTLFQAQDALAQTRLARLQAAVSLFQALGGDWNERSIGLRTKRPEQAASELTQVPAEGTAREDFSQ